MSIKGALTASAIAIAATISTSAPAQATADPLLGTIQTFGFNFCPRGWAQTNGQLLAISQNTALFSLLGTTYGGDGRTTFALPDLRGRSAIHVGTGPGLSPVTWGQKLGAQQTTLSILNMPSHNHRAGIRTVADAATSNIPRTNAFATADANLYANATPRNRFMNNSTVVVDTAGGSQPFSIQSPALGVYHCIAMQGIFPSRN